MGMDHTSYKSPGYYIPVKKLLPVVDFRYCDGNIMLNNYYAALLPRRGRILRRTLSVRPPVPLSLPSVTSRHLANYNDTHVLFGTR